MPIVRGQARTRRFFDWLAPHYDFLNAILFRPGWREKVREAFLPGRVLDVGVGTGYATGDLPGAVGIDLSLEMVSRTSSYRGDLVLADAMAAPFRSESFATIVCAGSFYYLPDPVLGLRAFHRLLTPGGRVVMLSPMAWFLRPVLRIFDRGEYETMAEDAGFSLERYEDLRGVACLVVMRKHESPRA
jgi:demethylmenaquinone methyltransferase/2-methoxy-6-polyprenyl-1,4-benzoquinol methylase